MTLYECRAETIDGQVVSLDRYRGRVLLVVNVASQCGFTPQYEGLEALYRRYSKDGLTVLGFPCNQFGSQEPGSAAEIRDFCTTRFDVSFPMFARIEVNGDSAHPLYTHLKSEKGGLFGRRIKWNFTKFLIDRNGRVRERHAPTTKPEGLADRVEALLAEPSA